MCIGGGKKPKTPDPVVVAQAQADANIKTAQAQTGLNRFDVEGPTGSTTWHVGEDGRYTQRTNLTPEQQDLFNQSQGNQLRLAEGQNYLIDNASEQLGAKLPNAPGQGTANLYRNQLEAKLYDPSAGVGTAFDTANQAQGVQQSALNNFGQTVNSGALTYNNLGALPQASEATRQSVADSLYNQSASRLDPRYSQQANDIQTQLAAQGITQGSAAYEREYDNFSRDKNDAYTSAMNTANSGSIDAMQQLYGMQLAGRQQGVNEANYLRANPGQEALVAAQLGSSTTGSAAQMLQSQIARESAIPAIASANYGLDQSAYGTELQGRNQVLNELMAVNGMANGQGGQQLGQQGGNIGGAGSGATIGQTPVADAAYNSYQGQMQQYNADVGSRNAAMGGVASIAAAGLMAF